MREKSIRPYAVCIVSAIVIATALSFQSTKLAMRLYREVFPDVSILRSQYPVAIGKQGNRNLYRFQKHRPLYWRSLGQIPKKVVGAVLMAEDSSFYTHTGYSAEGIRYALEQNSKPGAKVVRGGSTITQQVIKNLFLSPEKTMSRKVRELLLAMELERKLSKARILEAYLNIAEWGPGVYGIEQASRTYFGKTVTDLTARESATLAFMLPNPGRYRHSIRDGELTSFASRRVDAILEKMLKTGRITDEEAHPTGAVQATDLPSDL